MIKYFLLSVIVAFAWACGDDIENPSLSINPSDYLQLADTGEIMNFTVNAAAYKKHELQTFKISYSTKTEAAKIIIDSALGRVSKFYYEFNFRVPDYTDTTEVSFLFYILDDAGNFLEMKRVLLVQVYSESKLPLTEFAGNTMYSDPRYHGTAFDLLNCKLLSLGYADSSQMHIMADFDSSNANTLSRKWLSPAKLKFVIFNGFDYANATQQSVKEAYDAGSKNDFVANVSVNDIYLTKIPTGITFRYVAIRVMNINDDVGSANDMFIFNVKK
jgi:hypothetical protein